MLDNAVKTLYHTHDMSPEKARVFLVEDDLYSSKTYKEALAKKEHTVVEEAGSLVEALKKIPELGEKK